MKLPNKYKRNIIKRFINHGWWIAFPKNNHFSFYRENQKYYISNPLYRNYGIDVYNIKSQILAGRIYVMSQRIEYVEVNKNDFYHTLWNLLFKSKDCIAFHPKSTTKVTIPIIGSTTWDYG